MSGDTAFEYPDEAGYPDGMGTLDEGTREPSTDEVEEVDDDLDLDDDELDDVDIAVDDGFDEDGLDAVESELESFAMADEEDDEGV